MSTLVDEYKRLLIEHANTSKGKNNNQIQYRSLQERLLVLERALSSEEIITCARECFPRVHKD